MKTKKEKKGKGTGTVRREKFDAQFGHLPDCEHKCPKCWKVWSHKAAFACHYTAVHDCEDCMCFPDWKKGMK